MKPAVRPIWAAARGRLYSAQAARATEQVEARTVLPRQDAKISRLSNGAVVASIETYSPVARVAAVYAGGPRYETQQNQGVSHSLRSAANLSTEKSTSFGIIRTIQQLGGNIVASSSREHIFYNLSCIRDDLPTGLELLGHITTAPAFKTWEVQDNVASIQLDLANLPQETQLLEALHQAAYRDGLGNSLYMAPHSVGSHDSKMLRQFVSSQLKGNSLGVFGVGVDHDVLVRQAQKHFGHVPSGEASKKAATYFGGELRINNNSPLVHAAIVTEGVGFGSKEVAALAVLQAAMGSGPSIKYSSNMATSRVMQAAAQATSLPFAATCINATYSDSGLFGFYVVAQSQEVGNVLKSIANKFASTTKDGLKNEDLQRAKNQVKAFALMEIENSSDTLEDIATEVLNEGKVYSGADILAAVDGVTLEEVNSVAKKVINGKPTMAAVGDLSYTPYLDQVMGK